MGKYQGYEKYKDSGVEWLGEIPEHWNIQKFIRAAFFQEGPGLRNWQFADNGIRVICVTNITEKGIDFSSYQKFIEQEDYDKSYKHFTVKNNDLLLSSSGNSWGKVAEYNSDEIVILNTSTIRINEHETSCADRVFLKWTLQSFCLREQLSLLMTGSCQPNFGPSHLAKTIIAIPPLDEQKTLARFLDHKTKQIDDLIAKKETLIEKLNEKRTALISHAVTKGIDPSVPMKDSGIEWLGEIPEHWEVKRLKFLLSKPLKYGANEAAEIDDPNLPRYIRITDVKDDGNLRDDTFRSLPEEIAKDYILEEGDILLARSGATVGKTFIYRKSWGKAAYAGYLIRARISSQNNSDYIYKFLQSSFYLDWVNSIFIQATIQNISAEKYANLYICIPPLDEQQEIAIFLDQKTADIDQQKNKIQEAIERLKEYRTALITNAVTGKIDVRQVPIP